jgi:uncharacterized protein (TIGR03083 family)
MEYWSPIAERRRALADQLAGLGDDRWATPSLCGAWTVRDVVAHLIVPHVVSTPTFLVAMVRAGGRFPRANVAMTASVAGRPTAELVEDLRRYADSRAKPPIFDSRAPLTEILVHGQDVRLPLGLDDEPSVDLWEASLGFLVEPRARRGFVAVRLDGLRLRASDCGWTHGDGDDVTGPARALAMAVLGRTARAGELHGAGADRLLARAGS